MDSLCAHILNLGFILPYNMQLLYKILFSITVYDKGKRCVTDALKSCKPLSANGGVIGDVHR